MTTDWEITVWDRDYDVETYFYRENSNAWDKAMNEFAKLLTVTSFGNGGVTVNMAEVIEKKLPQLEEADLFIFCDIDSIMDDIDSVLAGNVDEEWLTEFTDALKRK
jgi:hypothetical protein